MEHTAQQILELEDRLLELGVRHSKDELDRLLADDFVEFGSSGRPFDKPAIISALAEETAELRCSLVDFRVRLVAPTVALATYVLVGTAVAAEQRRSLRSSLWVWRDERWQLLFHQGTASAPAEP